MATMSPMRRELFEIAAAAKLGFIVGWVAGTWTATFIGPAVARILRNVLAGVL